MNYTYLFNLPDWKTIGDDTQYLLHETDDEYIIAFYGSNSKTDWKYNFMFRKKPYKHMPIPFSVHRGFLKVWKLINDYFLALAKDVNKPIVVVGHSYGGAVASLCAEDIWFNFPDKRDTLQLVTYGAPRILGWRNYKKIRERWMHSINYSNAYDLVSMIPFFLMGYRHTKKRTFIGKDKPFFQKFKIINNHMIWEYAKRT
jgi:predicted lipase